MGERYMTVEVIKGILIPFLGTSAGAGCVFFMRGKIHPLVQRALIGFASGVMVAASIWSLLIPAMEQVASEGIAKVIPAVAGFWFGILFLLLLDHVIPHLHMNSEEAEGPERARTKLQRTTMLVLAVTIHNIPEGMAVGLAFSLAMSDPTDPALFSGAAALSGKRIPHSDQTRQKILQIRTFDLQTGFFCPSTPVKNFQNQVRPIPDRNLQLILQVSLLGRCQGVVKNHAVCIQHGNQIFDLFHLSCPDIKGIIDHRKILHNLRRCFDLTRLRKVFQLLHRMVKIQIFV